MTDYNSSPTDWADMDMTDLEISHPVPEDIDDPDLEEGGMVLAMAYVKRQKWSKPLDCEAGLREGTIFPELVKPFQGQGGCSR